MKQLWRSIFISALTLTAINLPAAIPAQTTLAIRGGLSRATLSGVPTEGVPESGLKARTGLSLGASATFPVQETSAFDSTAATCRKGTVPKHRDWKGISLLTTSSCRALGP